MSYVRYDSRLGKKAQRGQDPAHKLISGLERQATRHSIKVRSANCAIIKDMQLALRAQNEIGIKESAQRHYQLTYVFTRRVSQIKWTTGRKEINHSRQSELLV